MRTHKTKRIDFLDVEYRPLTIADELAKKVITSKPLLKHHTDYVYLMALFDSKSIESVKLKMRCSCCGEKVRFVLQRNQIMIKEMASNVFGSDIKIQIKPSISGDIIDSIEYVFIDGERYKWEDCRQSEKEQVLESIDYEVFKSISAALNEPTVTANVPVVCSCGNEFIMSLNGLQEFLGVLA